METAYFFGYGSLVNRATHDYPEAQPAWVIGWQREWKKTAYRMAAFLSVTQVVGAELGGLIAAVPGQDWAALDLREAAYFRKKVAVRTAQATQRAEIYQVHANHVTEDHETHPILLSYLDTVLQGYAQEFGPSGVADFFATTSGWELGILNDRDAPIYSRTQPLLRSERDMIDRHLADVGCKIVLQDPRRA
ncbi:MAG: gamma-glutamylcyclotransferase family protein [Pseudomonadota bacterium]